MKQEELAAMLGRLAKACGGHRLELWLDVMSADKIVVKRIYLGSFVNKDENARASGA